MRIAIIGAGAGGLAAAWDLCRAGHSVTVYESEGQVGGLAAGFRDEAWEWPLEKFYHHWFETDKAILGLAEELGVRDQFIFPRPKTSFWIDGQIVRSEITPSSVFGLPLSPWGLLRFALGGAFLKLTPFWKPLERVTADEWMQQWMGREGYEKFFKPLLIGKFAEDYDKVNMAWMWARVVARSLRLGTFQGGFQTFMDTFARRLCEMGVTIHLNTPIRKIRQDGLQPVVDVNGEHVVYDRVISTTSPWIMLRLVEGLSDTDYGDRMRQLKSIGGICVVLALRQQLMTDGTYWLSLPSTSPKKSKSEFPFLALVEHTNYMDKAHYGGDHIIYCGDYVPANHEHFQMSEDALVARFLPTLKKINPNFDESWVRKSWVWRAPYAQPVPTVYQSAHIPPLQTPFPGILWASMSQVYPWDRGTNYAVELARLAARIAMGEKEKPRF